MENVHSDVRVLRVEGKFSLAMDKWAGKTKQNHTEYCCQNHVEAPINRLYTNSY